MSQSSKQFWASFSATVIPLVVVAALWLLSTGGKVGVTVERLENVETRVSALEASDRSKTELLAEIRTDVKWLVRRETDKEDRR